MMKCFDFNSMKVRLIHFFKKDANGKAIFQFHEGSINTAGTHRCSHHTCNFNSMKVRLIHYQIFKEQQKYNISIP